MKYWIIGDEWYPVYSFCSEFGYDYNIDLSDEEKARADKAFKEFDAVQKLLEKKAKESKGLV